MWSNNPIKHKISLDAIVFLNPQNNNPFSSLRGSKVRRWAQQLWCISAKKQKWVLIQRYSQDYSSHWTNVNPTSLKGSHQHSAKIAHTQPVLSFPALFNLPLCTLCQGKQIKYIWFIISFKCFIAFVVEQPCVRLRGGQCFSPQKIPSL